MTILALSTLSATVMICCLDDTDAFGKYLRSGSRQLGSKVFRPWTDVFPEIGQRAAISLDDRRSVIMCSDPSQFVLLLLYLT